MLRCAAVQGSVLPGHSAAGFVRLLGALHSYPQPARGGRLGSAYTKHVTNLSRRFPARAGGCHAGSMRPAARLACVAVAAVLLLGLAGRAQAQGEEEEEAVALFFGDGESLAIADHFGSRKQQIPPGPAADGEEEGEEEEGEEKRKGTIAQILDEALKEEFRKEEEKSASVGKQFNETVASEEGTQETVVIISSSTKKKSNATADDDDVPAASKDSSRGSASGDAESTSKQSLFAGLTGGGLAGGVLVSSEKTAEQEEKEEKKKELEEKLEMAAETDVDRIIDSKDNEYVLSKPNDDTMGMNLDPHFVKDLTVLIAASAAAGLFMGWLGQPAINGYFIAGSLVGPGGLKLIKEIVQVQSVAQLGVQLLLFSLGLEFSLTKLRAVRDVALLGGLLQTALFAILAGVGAKMIGTGAAQGAFVGAMVAMSSTSIVVKVLADSRTQNTQSGQITIGTLILQDCLVGLLFAFMPVLATASDGGSFDIALLLTVMGRVAVKLAVLAVAAFLVARTVLPPAMRTLAQRFGSDSFQLASIAFCLLCALATARQGISAELGAFVAGVMLSATEQQEAVLHHLEPVAQFFLALFISSIGLVLSPVFLINHLPVLAMGALAVVISKTILIAAVVSAFKYPLDTALSVGINLSQIGEFVFVLLSVANQQNLLADNVYMLLMGVTAMTLLVTPFLLQVSNRFNVRSRGHPNGPGSGDLEMAPGGGAGSAMKRRPSPVKMIDMDRYGSLDGPNGAGGGGGSRVASPDAVAAAEKLLGSALTFQEVALANSLQPVRTKLEHRGTAHRTVQVLAHSSSGGSNSIELQMASGAPSPQRLPHVGTPQS